MKLSRNTNTNTNIKTKKGLSHHGTPTVPHQSRSLRDRDLSVTDGTIPITTTAAGDADIVSATCAATPSVSNRDPFVTPNTMAAGRWMRLDEAKLLSDEYFMKWPYTTGSNGLYFYRDIDGFTYKFTPQQLIGRLRDKLGIKSMEVQLTQKGHEKVRIFGSNTRNMILFMGRILHMHDAGEPFKVILDFQDFQDRLNEDLTENPGKSEWMYGRREMLKAAKLVIKDLEYISYDERILYYFSLLFNYGELGNAKRSIAGNHILLMSCDGQRLRIEDADCTFDDLIEEAFNALLPSFYTNAFLFRTKHRDWPSYKCWDATGNILKERLFKMIYFAAGKRDCWIEMTPDTRDTVVRVLNNRLEELIRMNIEVMPEEAMYDFKSGKIGEPEFGWANSGIVKENVERCEIDLREDIVREHRNGRYVKSYEEVAEKMKRKWKNLEIGCSKSEVQYMLGTRDEGVFNRYVELGYFVEVSKGPGYKGGAWKLREAVDGTLEERNRTNRLGIKKNPDKVKSEVKKKGLAKHR